MGIDSQNLEQSTCCFSSPLSELPPLPPPTTPPPTATPLSSTAATQTPVCTPRCVSPPSRTRSPPWSWPSRRWLTRTLLRRSADRVRAHHHHRGQGDLHLRVREGGCHRPLHHHPGHLRVQVRDHEGDHLWSCRIRLWPPRLRPRRRAPVVPRGVPDPGLQGPPGHRPPGGHLLPGLPRPQEGLRDLLHTSMRSSARTRLRTDASMRPSLLT